METPARVIYAGIDVNKAQLDIDTYPDAAPKQFANNETGRFAACAYLQSAQVRLIVVEATGGLESPLVALAASSGLAIAVINPRQARDFAKAIGVLAKTAKVDALVLARFAEAVKPPVRALNHQHIRRQNRCRNPGSCSRMSRPVQTLWSPRCPFACNSSPFWTGVVFQILPTHRPRRKTIPPTPRVARNRRLPAAELDRDLSSSLPGRR